MQWGDPRYISTFPCSHGKSLGWNREIQNTRRKQTDEENSKEQEAKNGGKKKKRFLILLNSYVDFRIREGSPSVGNTLGLPPSCDPPSGEPTHMGTSPTT
jgi:hypothetical protein